MPIIKRKYNSGGKWMKNKNGYQYYWKCCACHEQIARSASVFVDGSAAISVSHGSSFEGAIGGFCGSISLITPANGGDR